MYDIIKKALDEALSEQYAAQLMGAADESYSFSPVFEKKMKTLVKKTDKPYIKYVQYLGVAACAAVAVGCSILMPKLISQNVPVETTPSLTVSAAPVTEEPPVSLTNDSEVIPPPTSSATTKTEPTESETAAETTSLPDSSESVTSFTEKENPDSAGISSETDTTEPIDDEFPARGDDSTTDDAYVEATDPDDEETDDSIYDEIDDFDGDDSDDDAAWDDDVDDSDYDSDNDTDLDEDTDDSDYDCDDDSDYDYDDDATVLPAIPEEKTLAAQVNTLIGCKLSESYPYSAVLNKDGKIYSFSEGLTIPETAERFRDKIIAEKLEKAELITGLFEVSDKYITVDISDVSPTLWNSAFSYTRSAYDSSPRDRYDTLFLGKAEEDTDADDDYADEEYIGYKTCTLIIYDNGIIAASSSVYSGVLYFRTDNETTDEIFARTERNVLPEHITETSALLEALASSADDIRKVYLCTTGVVYDIRMGAPCDGEYLYDLLKNHASEIAVSTGAEQRNGSIISFSFVSAKNSQSYTLILYSDSKAELRTQQNSGYMFTLPLQKKLETLNYLCSLNGKPAAVGYANLEEYLKGKNFTELSSVSATETDLETKTTSTYLVSDPKTLKKIYSLISENAKNSEYAAPSEIPSNTYSIRINVPSWNSYITIGDRYLFIEDGYTRIDAFRLHDKIADKILILAKKYGETVNEDISEEADEIDD